jgi:hypothetical protein
VVATVGDAGRPTQEYGVTAEEDITLATAGSGGCDAGSGPENRLWDETGTVYAAGTVDTVDGASARRRDGRLSAVAGPTPSWPDSTGVMMTPDGASTGVVMTAVGEVPSERARHTAR